MDGRGVEKGLSISELYHRVFPEYLAMGMTYDQFWKGDCTLVIPYREAYRIRQEEMNRMAWLQGLYMYKALQSTPVIVHGFARRDTKIESYPAKPLEFRKQSAERKDEEAKRASEHIRAIQFSSKHFVPSLNRSNPCLHCYDCRLCSSRQDSRMRR